MRLHPGVRLSALTVPARLIVAVAVLGALCLCWQPYGRVLLVLLFWVTAPALLQLAYGFALLTVLVLLEIARRAVRWVFLRLAEVFDE